MAKIIHRNSTIPASATEHFTTGVEGQTNVAIHVVQGERELAKDCRSLARFDLKGIPPMPAGLPRIEVKFLIDANGILHVSAREQRSGKEAEIEVQPSYGLTDEQVENMILESFDYAEEDFRQRQVIEARNEAETMLARAGERRKQSCVGAVDHARSASDIAQAGKALRAVMQERGLPGDSQRDRAAEPGHHAAGGVDDGFGGDHRRSRARTWTTPDVGEGPAAASRRAGGDRVTQASILLLEYSLPVAGSRSLSAKDLGGIMADEKIQGGGAATVEARDRTRSGSRFFPKARRSSSNTASCLQDHGKPESLLDVAMNFGIHLDHACGGNCACTTCHVW